VGVGYSLFSPSDQVDDWELVEMESEKCGFVAKQKLDSPFY
jgi:hypothetical protein